MNESYRDKKSHLKLKKFVKVFLMSFVAITLGFITIVVYYHHYQKINTVTDSISYKSSGTITPVICLKSNEFLDSNCSSENQSYVSSLIDKITLNYVYSLITNKYATYDYSYKITLTTKANEKGDSSKVVYNKSEVLDEKSGFIESTALVNLSRSYDIDFQHYNNLITSFKKNYVLALDSNLTINIFMTMTGHYGNNGETETKEHNIDIIVPLTEQTVNIDRSNLTFGTQETFADFAKETPQNIMFQKILYGIDIFVFILIIIEIIIMIPKENSFLKKLNKILKEYDRAIVKTNSIPKLTDYKIIYVDSFTELLDAKENLDKPILFCQGKHNDSARFIILNNDEAYVYYFDAYGEGTKNEK